MGSIFPALKGTTEVLIVKLQSMPTNPSRFSSGDAVGADCV